MARERPPFSHVSYYFQFFRKFPKFSVKLTGHARVRMEQHEIRLPQIRTALAKGSVLRVEKDIKTGLDKFRIVGSDADGRKLEVVVNLDESGLGRVTIITAFDSKVTATTGRQGKVN